MSFERLAELLFPDVERDAEYYERLYPPRKLPEGAKVTRLAPSPTASRIPTPSARSPTEPS